MIRPYRFVEVSSESPVSSHLDSDNQRRPLLCIGGCCGSELSEPYQPNMDYSKATMKVYSSQSRAFRREWFVDHILG